MRILTCIMLLAASHACLAAETVPANVTEEMLFADDPKDWLSVSRVLAPKYPSDQFAAGVTGKVDVDVVVDELGAVKSMGAIRSTPPNPAFEAAVRDSVKHWTFKSKLNKECKPEPAQGNVRVWFDMKDGKESVSVSSQPGTMGLKPPETGSRWRPLLNYPEIVKAAYYPPTARKNGDQAAIYTVLHIDSPTGLVKDVEFTHAISSSSMANTAFRTAVKQAVLKARFEPRPDDPKKVFKVCIPFMFFLRN